MKILIFNWRDIKHPQAGGSEQYLHQQSLFWLKKGHEVTWITSKPKDLTKEEIIDGIKIFRAGNKLTSFVIAPLIYFLKGRESDVIIDSGSGFPFFTPIYTSKKIFLVLYHYHKEVWYKEYNFIIANVGRFLESVLTPLVYRNSKIITISESSRRDLMKIMPKKDIKIVYCGIDPGLRPGMKSKKPEITFIGRIKKYKGIEILLKAASLVDKNILVNIIGRGDYEKELKKLAKELGLKNVIFHGFLSESEKIKILQRSWIAVNPSFVEGWGITNIEAAACGTASLGSNVRGINESILEGRTGFLFEYGNYVELAEKIKHLLEDAKKRKEIEKMAPIIAKNYSWEKSAKEFLNYMDSF